MGITIDKAIEILTFMTHHPWGQDYPDHGDALILGIEALKRLNYYRPRMEHPITRPLPGETKD